MAIRPSGTSEKQREKFDKMPLLPFSPFTLPDALGGGQEGGRERTERNGLGKREGRKILPRTKVCFRGAGRH